MVPVSEELVLALNDNDLETLLAQDGIDIRLVQFEAESVIRPESVRVFLDRRSGLDGHGRGVATLLDDHPVKAVNRVVLGRQRSQGCQAADSFSDIFLAEIAETSLAVQTVKRGEGRHTELGGVLREILGKKLVPELNLHCPVLGVIHDTGKGDREVKLALLTDDESTEIVLVRDVGRREVIVQGVVLVASGQQKRQKRERRQFFNIHFHFSSNLMIISKFPNLRSGRGFRTF